MSLNTRDVKQTADLTRPSLWQRIPSGVKKGAAVLAGVGVLGLGVLGIYEGEKNYTASLAREADDLVMSSRFPIEQTLVNRADSLKHRIDAIRLSAARDINPATWFESGRNLDYASRIVERMPNTGYPHN